MRAALALALMLGCRPATSATQSSPTERLAALIPPDEIAFGPGLQRTCGVHRPSDTEARAFWAGVLKQIATCVADRHALVLVDHADRTITETRIAAVRVRAAAISEALGTHGVDLTVSVRVSLAAARPTGHARYLDIEEAGVDPGHH